ncbi:MAG: hypothetical protein ACK5MV_14590, partial [Aminipila sp.]
MFYVELFKVATIGVIYIVLVNLFIYNIVIEYDKSVKIKNYKTKKGFFPRLARYLLSLSYILFFIGFPLFTLYYFLKDHDVVFGKALEVWYKQTVGQILVVGGVIVLSAGAAYFAVYSFDAFKFLPFFYFFGAIVLFFSAVFFAILFLKQIINLYKAHRTSFNVMSKQYQGMSTKEKWTKIAEDNDVKQFDSKYCVIYESEEEWKNSVETKKTYGQFYKILQVYSPIWILCINILFAIFYFDIIPAKIFSGTAPVEIMDTYNSMVIWYFIWGILYSGCLMFYGGLTYLFNPNIAVKKKCSKKETKDVKFYQILFTALLIFLMSVSSILYYRIYTMPYVHTDEMLIEFDDYKELVNETLKRRDQYQDYSFFQQVQYLTSNPRGISSKIEQEGYKESDVFDFAYDIAIVGLDDEMSIDEAIEDGKEKGYVCQLTSCKFSIPLLDDKFSHIVITQEYIVVYYNEITKTPIGISINDYT